MNHLYDVPSILAQHDPDGLYKSQNYGIDTPRIIRCPWSGKPCSCSDFPWKIENKIPPKCKSLKENVNVIS